jgi:hypothetical protein
MIRVIQEQNDGTGKTFKTTCKSKEYLALGDVVKIRIGNETPWASIEAFNKNGFKGKLLNELFDNELPYKLNDIIDIVFVENDFPSIRKIVVLK